MGAFATVLRPKLTFHIEQHLRMYYEAELGLNYWSKNNPDQQDPTAPDVFVLKHREVYAEGEFLQNQVGFKTGYQYFSAAVRDCRGKTAHDRGRQRPRRGAAAESAPQ